jgi:hypothetical protein
MADPSSTPPTPPPPRQALVARTEQVVLVLLALALVAGVAYRAVSYWRIGQEPLEVLPPPEGPNFRVNVNTADWPTLSMVPGLGPKLSQRIVELRDSRPDRRLHALEELKDVTGISDKTLAKLKPYLVLDDPGPEAVHMVGAPESETPAPPPSPTKPARRRP